MAKRTSFEKYTNGFSVETDIVGIEAAKITKDVVDERVVTATTNEGETADDGKEIPSLAKVTQMIAGVQAGEVVGAQNAKTADKLTAEKTIASTGDVKWSVSFDGSKDVSGTATITKVPYSALPVATAANSTETEEILNAKQVNDLIDGITSEVNTKITGVYKVKGTATVADIKAITKPTTGDVYNVSDAGTIATGVTVLAGDNVVWTGDAWDKLAATVDISGKLDSTTFTTWRSATFQGKDLDKANKSEYADYAKNLYIPGDGITEIVYAEDVSNALAEAAYAYSWVTENEDAALDHHVETSGYITGDGREETPVKLTDDAKAKIDGAFKSAAYSENATTKAGVVTFTKNDASTTSVTIPVASTTVSGLMTADDKTKLDGLGTSYADKAYASVTVDGKETSATKRNDKIGFKSGTAIALTATTDTNGTPTIEVSAKAASTTAAGITKAAYYDSTDMLIHLF